MTDEELAEISERWTDVGRRAILSASDEVRAIALVYRGPRQEAFAEGFGARGRILRAVS